MNPDFPAVDHDENTDPPSLTPSSEVGSDTQWRALFEMQQKNMMLLIEAIISPTTPEIILPEIDPDQPDVDVQAWCNTAEICFGDQPPQGSSLVIALSKALKGSASTWLSQISHAGMTWQHFRELFQARYELSETLAATLINLNNGRPKENECLAAYASRLMTSLTTRWKNLDIEEIVTSYVLAHIAQYDPRVYRLAFTTEIKTRNKLLQEVKACSNLKRRLGPEYTSDAKRLKMESSTQFKCHNCGKLGHKAVNCRSGVRKTASNIRLTIQTQTAINKDKQVICYRCGESGHIASKCRRGAGVTSKPSELPVSSGRAGVAHPTVQQRVDSCEVSSVIGQLVQSDIPGANVYVFQGNINRYINDYAYSTGEISANIVVTDDRVYENLEVALKQGDVVYYYYYYIKDLDGVFHKVEDQSFTVKELVDPDTDIEQMTETCLGSPTQVPDVKVCSNRIIFEDNFDQLRQDAWTLEQYIPAEPDYTFVSYQHDPRVRTITSSGGMLTIHPLLLGAIPHYNSVDSVYTAYLNLTDGCTSNLKAECEMQPSGASILPPLVSGRMNSKFAFKYGTIKIRAKLPKGDWLYPDILLQSIHVKHDASYFDTGVVRIAGARGNSVLKGEDVEYGNKVLYGGIMLDRACRGHMMNRTRSNKAWGDDFHVYSIRWAPESITFFVDGEEWHRVQPTGGTANLRETFPSECQLPTNGTSKMAPFDDYFRLTLGVAAGGVLEFEDDLVSKDGVKKPWKNAGRKALFHFWQSQQSWWPSWSQEKAMVVDYVRIRAL